MSDYTTLLVFKRRGKVINNTVHLFRAKISHLVSNVFLVSSAYPNSGVYHPLLCKHHLASSASVVTPSALPSETALPSVQDQKKGLVALPDDFGSQSPWDTSIQLWMKD